MSRAFVIAAVAALVSLIALAVMVPALQGAAIVGAALALRPEAQSAPATVIAYDDAELLWHLLVNC